MKISKDAATTVLGGLVAVGTGLQPVVNGLQGDMGSQDIIKLVTAVLIAIFGYFTNRGSVSGDKP